MNTVATWPSQAESWLDHRGRGAWILASIAGFVAFWPIGLGILGYALATGRMRGGSCGRSGHGSGRKMRMMRGMGAYRPSGNRAFDAYKEATLRRLEDEQEAFDEFLARLREAKDKAEFDQFMDERARNAKRADESDQT